MLAHCGSYCNIGHSSFKLILSDFTFSPLLKDNRHRLRRRPSSFDKRIFLVGINTEGDDDKYKGKMIVGDSISVFAYINKGEDSKYNIDIQLATY